MVPAGLLYAAAFAPLGWWPAQFVALAMFQYGILGAAASSHPWRGAAIAGFMFGVTALGSGATWAYAALHLYSGLGRLEAALFTLIFVIYLSAFAVIPSVAAVWVRLRTASDLPALTSLAGCWLVGEWLRRWFWGGYTLGTIGYAHVDGDLAGYAPVIGVYGLSLLAFMTATASMYAMFHPKRTYRLQALLLTLVILLGGRLLAKLSWTEPFGEPLDFRLIQGNISQAAKFGEEGRNSALKIYKDLISDQPADVVLTPETALPLFLGELPGSYVPSLKGYADKFGSTIILGLPLLAPDGRAYNSMLGIAPLSRSDSMMRYDKIHLAPIGEYSPLGLAWLTRSLSIPLKDLSSGGTLQPLFRAKDQLLGITICHDDQFGDELAVQLRGATILVNASNQGWFEGSIAFWQRTQVSRMLALELGRPELRVTNNGTTSLIDVKGRIASRLPEFQRGVLSGTVRGYRGTTPYAVWRDVPVLLSATLLCLLPLALSLRSPSRRQGVRCG